uniref:Polyadenylate-binding protein n=1 Tax=Arcella intermedia TaxID=1963864 RepID=A0A6B2L5P2_9EUKA
MVVKQFIPKKERIQQRASTWTNVFVKNLNSSITDVQLNELFSQFGKITSGVVMKNEDGSSRCFGFVNFDTHENAERAAQQMHEKEFEGRKLWCGPAQKKSERWLELEKQRKLSKGTNLYLKNFDDDLTEEKLRQYFSKEAYGEIKSVKIMTDDKGLSRGFGFISFGTSQGTAIALNEMNGRPLPGSRKPLYVAYHEPKAIRQKKLQTRFANRTYAKSRSPAPMAMYPYYSQYPVYPQPNPRRPNTWPAPHAPYPVPQMQPYQPQPPMQSRPKPTRPPVPAQAQPAQPIKRGTQTRKPMIQTESGEVPLTIGALAKYPEEQQRLLLGERLYPIIQKTQPTLAGKITGMLLDSGWKIEDLLSLLYDEDKLNEKVADAAAILEKVNTTNQ